MKQTFSLLLLTVLTVAAYADKNSKTNKVQSPHKTQHEVTSAKDTVSHYEYGVREYDPRMGRSMYVAPKEQQQENPYLYAEDKNKQ